MSCKQINDLMMKYFDGNISELELEQLLRHNQKCPSCAEEFEVLKDAIYEIENLPDIEVPKNLTANIMTAIADQSHYHIDARQLICWILGFTGLVLFTYNILAFVVVPLLGGTPLVSFQSVLDFISLLGDKAKDGFVIMSIFLGKLVIVRDILFRDYGVYMLLWLGAFGLVDLMLYRLIRMRSKNDILT